MNLQDKIAETRNKIWELVLDGDEPNAEGKVDDLLLDISRATAYAVKIKEGEILFPDDYGWNNAAETQRSKEKEWFNDTK